MSLKGMDFTITVYKKIRKKHYITKGIFLLNYSRSTRITILFRLHLSDVNNHFAKKFNVESLKSLSYNLVS